ncbi:hypothetical protein [Paraflavitalea speifideaquila]|nr:hypothetical protein [Paraflavitalea speifideiaquila]
MTEQYGIQTNIKLRGFFPFQVGIEMALGLTPWINTGDKPIV